MGTSEEIRLELPEEHAAELVASLEAVPDVTVSRPQSSPPVVRLGRDSRYRSAIPEVVGVLVAGAGVARALSPALVAYVGTKKRRVRVVRADGSAVEIDGDFTAEEVQAIVDDATDARALPPAGEA